MSGIVGIVSLDGRPVNEDQLRGLTAVMRVAGPDGQTTWVRERVGFGHALLRTTSEPSEDRQLVSLDERAWIVADARVDGRQELAAKLAARGRANLAAASDAELILHAYAIWRETCVDHLLGDFAFAIWDNDRQRLFCARDHVGVKPFYYAMTGDHLLFSNVLRCIRAFPGLSNRLNDQAVADYLLFGDNQAFDTTIFEAIRRLPPAHTLIWEPAEAVRIQRYWSLPVEGTIRYKRKEEYIENFQELLRQAVGDRLRTRQVGVYMSGGLDSTSVAATARELLGASSETYDLRAYTFTADKAFSDDQEGHYAGLAAEFLGMTHHRLPSDDDRLYGDPDNPTMPTPEPVSMPLWASLVNQARIAAEHGPVVLTGQGGDPNFYPSRFYLYDLLKTGRLITLITDLSTHFSIYHRLPPLYIRMIVDSARGGILSRSEDHAIFPPWLNPDFVNEMGLKEKFKAHYAAFDGRPANAHPIRPEAAQNLAASLWPNLFEHIYQADVLATPIEVRHPLFDIRLISYLMSLPPVPWFVNKTLTRLAMKGQLPEAVRLRDKAMATGLLESRLLRNQGINVGEIDFDNYPDLRYYIDSEQFSRIAQMRSRLRMSEAYIVLRPLSFYHWFRHVVSGGVNLNGGKQIGG